MSGVNGMDRIWVFTAASFCYSSKIIRGNSILAGLLILFLANKYQGRPLCGELLLCLLVRQCRVSMTVYHKSQAPAHNVYS